PVAIGDREGVARLQLNASSMGHTLRPSADKFGSAIEVGMSTLDQLLLGRREHLRWRRILLKIDVEGCELEVLSGARRLLSEGKVVAIVWEKANFFEGKVQGERMRTIFDLLNSHGFEHFSMRSEASGVRLGPLQGQDFVGDVFSLAAKS